MLVSVSNCTFCYSSSNFWAKIINIFKTNTFFLKKNLIKCIFNNYYSPSFSRKCSPIW